MDNNVIDRTILEVRVQKRRKHICYILWMLVILIIVLILDLIFFKITKSMKLSNNNLLTSLKIEHQNILWDSYNLHYNVSLIEGEKQLAIHYQKADDRANVIILGNNDLTIGSKVEILVIAEDNTTRSYILTVDRIVPNRLVTSIDYCDQLTSNTCIRYLYVNNQVITLNINSELALDPLGQTYSLIVNNQKILYLNNPFNIRIVGIYQDKIVLAYKQYNHNELLIIDLYGNLIKKIVELDKQLGMYINDIDINNIYMDNNYIYLYGSRINENGQIRLNNLLLDKKELTNIKNTAWYVYDILNNNLYEL